MSHSFAPTLPPSAGVSTGCTTVRDASAIPCRGALGVRAERGVCFGMPPKKAVPGRYKGIHCLAAGFSCQFFRSSPLRGVVGVQTWMVGVQLAHMKHCHLWCSWQCLVSWRFRQFVSMVSRHHQFRGGSGVVQGVVQGHGRSGSLSEKWCQFCAVPWAQSVTRPPAQGGIQTLGSVPQFQEQVVAGFVVLSASTDPAFGQTAFAITAFGQKKPKLARSFS